MAKKSFTKRFKVTKTGKVLRRTQGQAHFRANKSRMLIKRRKDLSSASDADEKIISAGISAK